MSIRFKCSPELSDGISFTVVNTPEEVISGVLEWAKLMKEYGGCGECFEIEVVDMSDEEFEKLPLL